MRGGVVQNLKPKQATCGCDKPLYAKGVCRSCYEKELRRINPSFAERQRRNCREWSKQNIDRKKSVDKAYRAKLDPAYHRARHLKMYGITPAQYDDILASQGGVCNICGKPPGKNRLAVDHDHDTGEIRGLLCFRCNFGLSWFNEDQQLLKAASDHLNRNNFPRV